MSAEAVSNLNHAAVVAALQKASVATGSDFSYLLKTATRESGLNAGAKSASSSASGLFQFVEQTWLGLVKEYGPRHGLGSYAAAISKGADGRYRADGADRQAILSLRNDAQVSALMAGEYVSQCKTRMEGTLGRSVGGGELYAAHFLGADSACRLIRLCETSPDASAAAVFPQAAGANRSVFFHSDGSAKTVREVYDWAAQQPSTNYVAAAPAPSSHIELVSALAGFENSLLASALLSEPSSADFFGGSTSGAASAGSRPFRLSAMLLDYVAAAQSGATKKADP
jgi:hypothetical protein